MLNALLLLAAALLELFAGKPASSNRRKPPAPGGALDHQAGYWRKGRYVRSHYRRR